MSDMDIAIAMVQNRGPGALSVDQVMSFALSGMLPPLPPPGVRVQFLTSVPPYTGGECVRLHKAISDELVRRGVADYA